MAKHANRPSMQLLVERDLVRKFRGMCISRGTTMSRVVESWVRHALDSEQLPADALKPKPHAKPPRPR